LVGTFFDMNHLDLCSGIGGFALAARRVGWNTIGFCDNDVWCRKVLKKHWPNVPIYNDVKELPYDEIGPVDIITAGYPCQPFSVAGDRRGTEDDRHIWSYIAESVRRLEPLFCVFENVTGHISMGIDDVLSDLEGLGYTSEAFIIPACAVDAPHRRDRVWILAYANSAHGERGRIPGRVRTQHANTGGRGTDTFGTFSKRRNEWEAEPGVCRVADGLSNGLDRLRGLGNAIVPGVAEVIFQSIQEIQNEATSETERASRKETE
jgi:DNA (cytosine-5)-methyltransferase 1